MKLNGFRDFSSLYKMIDSFNFLSGIGKKHFMLVEYLLRLKKQIVMIITLYKIIDILINAYSEYKEIEIYSSKFKSKLKMISSLIIQIFSIMAIVYDSKNGFM
jgi:hypothetical protein